jgi:hypothetical protein
MNPFTRKRQADSLPPPARLQNYNRLILQNQDEAFTLAFDLLGDELLASQVVEEAYQLEFRHSTGDPSKFRLEVLRLIIQNALKRTQVLPCLEIFGKAPCQLTNEEKLVSILVDCLELSYQEAAVVLAKPVHSIRKLLAETRFTLIRGATGKM